MRIFLYIVAGLAVLVGLFFWINRPATITFGGEPPPDFPDNDFSHEIFEDLLGRFVHADGKVDYNAWHSDADAVAKLDSYLAAIAEYSPQNAPERFDEEADALAYWMYAYNAYVIRSVLANWPIESVTAVRAPIEAVRGMGFFYHNRYVFGGEALSLLNVENERIRKRYRDPRIHFVLNCASESCPVQRPDLPTGDDLEAHLEKAAREFVNDPRNVSVDHDDEVVHLSAIFKWFRKDFVNALRDRGLPAGNGVLDYVAIYADDKLKADLDAASDYERRHHAFDWSLNRAESGEAS